MMPRYIISPFLILIGFIMKAYEDKLPTWQSQSVWTGVALLSIGLGLVLIISQQKQGVIKYLLLIPIVLTLPIGVGMVIYGLYHY